MCIDPAAFEHNGRAERLQLQRLLMRVRLGQHTLLLADVDAFLASEFFNVAVAQADRVEVAELLTRQRPELADRSEDPAALPSGPYAELSQISVTPCRRVGAITVWAVDPSNAGDWAEAPVRLLLENDGDWTLFTVAARIYGRPAVVEAERNGFLRKDQRGGKDEVRKAIKSAHLLERTFALLDSDRIEVGGAVGSTQQSSLTAAEELPQVTLFILPKREAENYVPSEVWADLVPKGTHNRDAVRNYRRWKQLSDEEKDVADLEAYFPTAKRQVSRMNSAHLVPNIQTLESRAGRDLANLLDKVEPWL